MYQDFFVRLLQNKTLVLTANRRLSAYLLTQFAEYQRSKNQKIWETPKILPLNAWLNQLGQTLNWETNILSPLEEQIFWKTASKQNWSSINTIQQAWEHLSLWQIDLHTLAEDPSSNVRQFYEWALAFKTLCEKHQSISAAELPRQLIHCKALQNHLPSSIALLGFDQYPPAIEQFIGLLEQHASIEHINQPDKCTQSIKRFEFLSTENEIETMLSWAQKKITQNKDLKLACIVPKLTQLRRLIISTCRKLEISPENYNISAGQPLNEFLFIKTAYAILKQDWNHILQSPYLAHSDSDCDMAAEIDRERRNRNALTLATEELLALFTRYQARFPKSTFLKRWNTFIQLEKNLPSTQSLSDWIETFLEILSALGWPGSRTLDSMEHQILHRWLSALSELSQTSDLFGTLSFDEALALLEHHGQQIIFQPKGEKAPIQILGVLEAAGFEFDTAWLMGLDSESWPPQAAPNPFLPYTLQRNLKMPHASADRELIFTKIALERFTKSTTELIYSSATNDGDKTLTPSFLIQSVPVSKLSALPEKTPDPQQAPLELIENTIGLAWPCNQTVPGGTVVLKWQALCPFSAYAMARLQADALPEPKLGIPPSLRGRILHEALELIWRDLKSHACLNTLSSEELEKRIDKQLKNASLLNNNEAVYPVFLETEKMRLKNVLLDWLLLEKNRQPFHVISQEEEHYAQVGTLRFRCRIDRVDELENGAKIVIDYKSGLASPHNWFTQRLPEPQLPLYCAFTESTAFDGIAFAQVRTGTLKFKGIISDRFTMLDKTQLTSIAEFTNPDAIQDWSTLISHWKISLEKLSEEFSQGYASVDPQESACTYCHLTPLCRVRR